MRKKALALSFLLGFGAALAGLGVAGGANPIDMITGESGPLLRSTPSERLIVQGSVIDIAKKAQPAVVGIQTRQSKDTEPFHKSLDKEVESVGSGIIIRSDGYIITNSHVVNEAGNIMVTVNGEKIEAGVVGADKDSDIAVIKVERTNLPAARLGRAGRLQVGELAVAIGSPFGFQQSVTAGVISALDRNVTVNNELSHPRTYTNLIQTDAAINPGNSGGALINQKGEVVGVNTLIYSTNGVSQGIGFAIPIDEAAGIANQLIDGRQTSYPYIGVEGRTLDLALIKREKLTVSQGAIVVKVAERSPAEAGGIREGDVIVEFAGASIASMDDLVAAVRRTAVNGETSVKINRRGKNQLLVVKPTSKPANF